MKYIKHYEYGPITDDLQVNDWVSARKYNLKYGYYKIIEILPKDKFLIDDNDTTLVISRNDIIKKCTKEEAIKLDKMELIIQANKYNL